MAPRHRRVARERVDVHAVDLPTCSAEDNSVGAHDDARYLRAVLDEIQTPVVLVGNSYGGFVMSEAAVDHPRVRRLVFIAAVMPDTNESLLGILSGSAVAGDAMGLEFLPDGRIVFDPDHDIRSCMQQAPSDEQEWVRQYLGRPMSMGPDPAVSLKRVAWEAIPSTYVVCADDRALHPDQQRTWAKERATDFVEWPVDHCPQHSHPDLVVELLAELARDG